MALDNIVDLLHKFYSNWTKEYQERKQGIVTYD